MTTRIPRNAKCVFYATETKTREDGTKHSGREQRSTTFREARDFLDSLNAPGGVSVWRASSNLTDAYATRDTNGSWTTLNRLTGTWEPLN
ncbi:hypothetical protein [Streptomyces sp. B1I3]|uniref:hypothetical protein n=1 Tax=Streptomyces sp. B1I3 TaxID=3042264 RepID=UPI00277E2105|nr:hypothetical protein [Streptomyces sp. B1I3]MDQ0791996.1 hypothetical protein [Streptomyces sp. B1I3]